jgi:hypothetical protein
MMGRCTRVTLVKRSLSTSALVAMALVSSRSSAQPNSSEARAETLFDTAKQLQSSGQVADACPLFAESKLLVPGVGVQLHLADCYERLGRTASAWQEFSEAERLARERGDDKRAAVAQGRARALEPKLERLTLATSIGPHPGWQVVVDGAPLPADHWNAALAMDPGDHIVVVDVPDRAQRTLHAYLDPTHRAVTLLIDDGVAAVPPVPPIPRSPVEPSAPQTRDAPTPSDDNAWRTWSEVGLVGVAATGLGFGSFFMIRRGHFIQEGGPPSDPSLTNQATTAATISFVASGVALTSAFVLFFTTPLPKTQVGWSVSPVPFVGGGGVIARAAF